MAIKVLAGIMNQAKAPAAARTAAASAILDRAYGKPKQEIEHSGDAIADFLQAVASSQTERIPTANGHDTTAPNGHDRTD